jgi:DNA-binding MarR family transcriptional regulator
MFSALCDPSCRENFLALARDRSPAEELKCRALLDLLDAGQAFNGGFRRELGASGLTESGFLVLAHLISTDPEATGDTEVGFAQTLRLSRPVLAEVLGRLEVSGLIARQRPSRHRGGLAIMATELGRQVFSTALASALNAVVRAAATLDDRETALVELACVRLRKAFAPDPSL